MEETFFTCPHCWENVSILVDVSVLGRQNFVEDCEVCCHPLDFCVETDGRFVLAIEVERAQ